MWRLFTNVAILQSGDNFRYQRCKDQAVSKCDVVCAGPLWKDVSSKEKREGASLLIATVVDLQPVASPITVVC